MTIADKLIRAKEDYDAVYEAGKQKQQNDFWDKYQKNGTRTDYEYAFAGRYWTDELFTPKYPFLNVRSPYMMFMGNSNLTYIPAIEFHPSASYSTIFRGCKALVTIEKLKFTWPSTTTATINSDCFRDCNELQNLVIEGVLYSGLNLSYSTKLSKASIESVINALDTTRTGLATTFSATAVKKAFETATDANDGNTSAEWLALIATKSNWTISLV